MATPLGMGDQLLDIFFWRRAVDTQLERSLLKCSTRTFQIVFFSIIKLDSKVNIGIF